MTAKNFIEKRTVELARENVVDVQFAILCYFEENEPLPEWLDKKVERICNKYGLKRSVVLGSALSNELAATKLAKQPTRQAVGEKGQIEFLKAVKKAKIEKLPDNGYGSIRLKDGKAILDSKRAIPGATKSIDAREGNCFISLKYIKEAGGAQDNQIQDVVKFLENAILYTEKNADDATFKAVLDGDYAESKIKMLLSYTNDRVKVCTSDTYK